MDRIFHIGIIDERLAVRRGFADVVTFAIYVATRKTFLRAHFVEAWIRLFDLRKNMERGWSVHWDGWKRK